MKTLMIGALSILGALGLATEESPETGERVLTVPAAEVGAIVADLVVTADGYLWKGPAHREREAQALADYARLKGKFDNLGVCEQVYAGRNFAVNTPRHGVVHLMAWIYPANAAEYHSYVLREGGC